MPMALTEVELLLESGVSDPSIGGSAVFDSGYEPCTDPATTHDRASGLGPQSGPVSREGLIVGEYGQSWYRLSLDTPLWLRIDARSVDFDTILTVYDSSGWELHSNDDFSGTDSRIEAAFEPGAYCVGLRGFAGGEGTYSVAVATLDEEPASALGPCGDPERTQHLATDLMAGERARASGDSLDPETGQSWFAFSLAGTQDIRLDAASDSFDTVLELYDVANRMVAENDDGPDGGTDSRIETQLAGGSYCVLLRGFAGGSGDFTLALEATGGAGDTGGARGEGPADLPDPATAQDIEELGEAGGTLTSQRVSSDPTLWAAFSLAVPGAVEITGASVTSAFALALFDEAGTAIEASDRQPAFSTVQMVPDLAAGRYLVALTNLGGGDQIKLRQITVSPR